jgi:hypothetical protein
MTATAPIVRKVDHFYVRLDDPTTAMTFLTGALGLPVAWPFSSYGQFASGGVCLGNANFEVLQSSTSVSHVMATTPASISGIAFEPTPMDEAFLEDLDRRGISHTPPVPQVGTIEGAPGVLWTNVVLRGFISDRAVVFLCQYRPGAVDHDARLAALAAVGGGVLGIEGVEEIVVSSPNRSQAIARWQRLFDPIEQDEIGCWRVGEGPVIRIVDGERDSVAQLSLRVRSRRIAQNALDSLEVSSRMVGDDIAVDATPLAGLDVRLITAKP